LPFGNLDNPEPIESFPVTVSSSVTGGLLIGIDSWRCKLGFGGNPKGGFTVSGAESVDNKSAALFEFGGTWLNWEVKTNGRLRKGVILINLFLII
jgi:hypothetical protein